MEVIGNVPHARAHDNVDDTRHRKQRACLNGRQAAEGSQEEQQPGAHQSKRTWTDHIRKTEADVVVEFYLPHFFYHFPSPWTVQNGEAESRAVIK